jgi:carboxyl-terminal processing protease
MRVGAARRALVVRSLTLAFAVAALAVTPWASAQERVASATKVQPIAAGLTNASDQVWITAKGGDAEALLAQLDSFSKVVGDDEVRASIEALKKNIAKRESDREARWKELSEELDKTLKEDRSDLQLGKALRSAVEMQLLREDHKRFLQEERISNLVGEADKAARAAEARGDWMMASELFVRLHALTEETNRYRKDAERVTQRLGMLRLYTPEQLWRLRDARQRMEKDAKPLPPYNPTGDDFNEKLRGVDETLMLRVMQYLPKHVERVPLNNAIAGGLEAVKTMVTTTDLHRAFKGLEDKAKAATMVAFLDAEIADVKRRLEPLDFVQQQNLLMRLGKQNDATVAMPRSAMLHEFGNGMMSQLDEFSAIIWPDEVRRFERTTGGKLVGIGVQIEFDPQSNIRVVAPLEGTPAQRAGIHAGDVITKVNGKAVFGMSLDQAVDNITGPPGTKVSITVEREVEEPSGGVEAKVADPGEGSTDAAGDGARDAAKHAKKEMTFEFTRTEIQIVTVKGWKRNGVKEDDWNWFIDPERGIGYVRLTQFTDSTTRDLDRAIREMKTRGLNGMILDLRFNPGGLLDQAVEVVRRFVSRQDGPVVFTGDAQGKPESVEVTRPGKASLAHVPIVVLINENSASASEIVSGALRYYGNEGDIQAMVLGERSFGKGSVQNVYRIPTAGSGAMIKLTQQYYMLPDRTIIHRKPGAERWGVEPNLAINMLPKQTSDALTIRRNADVLKIDETGQMPTTMEENANPDDLIAKGIDVQLHTALVLLQTQSVARIAAGSATKDK